MCRKERKRERERERETERETERDRKREREREKERKRERERDRDRDRDIFIDLQKFKYYRLLAKSSMKIKNSKIFAVNNHMQKLSFGELFTERSFCGKKL